MNDSVKKEVSSEERPQPQKSRKVGISRGDKILIAVALTLTLLWVIAGLFPSYWLFISSTKDQSAALKKPPSFVPQMRYEYSIELNVSEGYTEDDFRYDATLVLWMSAERFIDVSAGRFTVHAIHDGKILGEASLKMSDFKNRRDTIFFGAVSEKQLSVTKNFDAAFSCIQAYNYKFNGSGYRISTGKNADVGRITEFLQQSTDPENKAELASRFRMTTLNSSIGEVTSRWDWANLFSNFAVAWSFFENLHGINFSRFLLNSLFLAICSVVLTCIISSMCAYCLSKMLKPRTAGKYMMFFLATMMIPGIVNTIPLFLMIQQFNLMNNYLAILLPGTSNAVAILLFKGFFDGLPNDVCEAAKIDGAGYFRVYSHLVIPLSMPVFAVIAITSFVGSWNDYFWPFMVLKDVRMWTFPVVVKEMMSTTSGGKPDYTLGLAMSVMATIPTFFIFLFFQKQLTRGLVFSGLKG